MGLLYEHLCNHAADGHVLTEFDQRFYKHLRNVPVYEVSNVVSLLPDWGNQRESPISKRPPHDMLWVEWKYREQGDYFTDWSLGVFLEKSSREYVRQINSKVVRSLNQKDTLGRLLGSTEEVIDTYDEFYIAHFFKRVDLTNAKGISKGIVAHRNMRGVLSWSMMQYIFALKDDATKARTFGYMEEMKTIKAGAASVPFGLPGLMSFYADQYYPVGVPWPPFVAFSLLHCKNVSTDTVPGEPNPPRLVRRGWPPLKKEYKVLRLNLPAEMKPRGETPDSEADERRMRFHLCRGHFKNLQHERYKSKGWHWWPAHWKGDPAVGSIEKRYELGASQ